MYDRITEAMRASVHIKTVSRIGAVWQIHRGVGRFRLLTFPCFRNGCHGAPGTLGALSTITAENRDL